MIEIRNLQVTSDVVGVTNEEMNPNFFARAYVTNITFSTEQYIGVLDMDLLHNMLQQYFEISQNLAKGNPVTQFTQVK